MYVCMFLIVQVRLCKVLSVLTCQPQHLALHGLRSHLLPQTFPCSCNRHTVESFCLLWVRGWNSRHLLTCFQCPPIVDFHPDQPGISTFKENGGQLSNDRLPFHCSAALLPLPANSLVLGLHRKDTSTCFLINSRMSLEMAFHQSGNFSFLITVRTTLDANDLFALPAQLQGK